MSFKNANIFNFYFCFQQRESDLFSLELPHYPLDMLNSYVTTTTKTLWQLQNLYGQIPTVFGIGKLFTNINEDFKRLCSDLGEPAASADQPISHM